jgi:hypothetical protein
MVIMMTNRLLGIVIALALTSGIVAHAAQAPQRPLTPISLPDAIQTAASKVSETATGAVDPAAAIRAAYQRNRVALAHLRQQASPLKGSARATVDQLIADQEGALTETQRTALATRRPTASSAIAEMDKLVGAAEEGLNRELSKAGGDKSNNSDQGGRSQSNGQSEKSGKSGQSAKSGQGGNSQGGDN